MVNWIFKSVYLTLVVRLVKTALNKNQIVLNRLVAGTYLIEIKDLKSGQKVVEKIIVE